MYGRRRADRLLDAAALTGALLLVAGLVLLVVVLIKYDVEKASSWGSVLGATLAVAIALVTLGTWWIRRRAATSAPVSDSDTPRRPGGPRQPRGPRRRALLAAAGVFAVLGLIAGAIGLSISTGDPTDVPPVPETTGPVSLTGNPRTVDLCPLIDLAWLRQFGEPQPTPGTSINGCRARIDRPDGSKVRVGMYLTDYRTPAENFEDRGGTVQWIDGLSVVRDRPDDPDPRERCRRTLVLTDDTNIYVEAFSDAPDPPDLCFVADVATGVAVATLARDGLTHDPDLLTTYSLAAGDACEVLSPETLATVPGLQFAKRFPGFANWTCYWGGGDPSDPQVVTRFRLDTANLEQNYGEPTLIGGRFGYIKPEGGLNQVPRCTASIPHRRPVTGSSEIFSVTVKSDDPEDVNCERAVDLAEAALPNLPERR